MLYVIHDGYTAPVVPPTPCGTSDNFNRDDAATLGPCWSYAHWAGSGDYPAIVSNEAKYQGISNQNVFCWFDTAASGDDHWVQVTGRHSLGYTAVILRGDGNFGCILLRLGHLSKGFEVFDIDAAGAATLLYSAVTGVMTGTIKGVVTGTSVEGYLDGVLQCTVTTSILTGTAVGMSMAVSGNSPAYCDDFSFGS